MRDEGESEAARKAEAEAAQEVRERANNEANERGRVTASSPISRSQTTISNERDRDVGWSHSHSGVIIALYYYDDEGRRSYVWDMNGLDVCVCVIVRSGYSLEAGLVRRSSFMASAMLPVTLRRPSIKAFCYCSYTSMLELGTCARERKSD